MCALFSGLSLRWYTSHVIIVHQPELSPMTFNSSWKMQFPIRQPHSQTQLYGSTDFGGISAIRLEDLVKSTGLEISIERSLR